MTTHGLFIFTLAVATSMRSICYRFRPSGWSAHTPACCSLLSVANSRRAGKDLQTNSSRPGTPIYNRFFRSSWRRPDHERQRAPHEPRYRHCRVLNHRSLSRWSDALETLRHPTFLRRRQGVSSQVLGIANPQAPSGGSLPAHRSLPIAEI